MHAEGIMELHRPTRNKDFVSSPVCRADVWSKVGIICLQDAAVIAVSRCFWLSCIRLALSLRAIGLFVLPHGQRNAQKSYNRLRTDTGTVPIVLWKSTMTKSAREKKIPKLWYWGTKLCLVLHFSHAIPIKSGLLKKTEKREKYKFIEIVGRNYF